MAAPPAPNGRRAYIDWARGIAVLLMIEAHAVDAWTRAADRRGTPFEIAIVLGGFAAPLFLWLAGLGVALAGARAEERGLTRWRAAEALCRRGLEIFILAFLFRLQAHIVSPGGPLVRLFRVDILNVMGPAIAAAGLLWASAADRRVRAVIYALAAVVVAMVTPLVRHSPVIDSLPIWIQWYLRPAGEYTTFTFFPWVGFVAAGAACGSVLVLSTADRRQESRIQLAFFVAGALLIVSGFAAAARPSLYADASFWTTSPTWFAIRVGVMMVALAVLYGVAASGVVSRPLERFGRHSLFVYWIHVELVYGYASWLWRGRLPLWGTGIGLVAFCFLMYRAIDLRDAVVRTWQQRPKGRRATAPATA